MLLNSYFETINNSILDVSDQMLDDIIAQIDSTKSFIQHVIDNDKDLNELTANYKDLLICFNKLRNHLFNTRYIFFLLALC